MKALIYYGPRNIRLEELPKPVPGPKDVIVKVMRAGICGSDVKAYIDNGASVGIFPKGTFGLDGQMGHEMVGIVDEVGSEVQDISAGDRVFVNPTVCKRSGMMTCDMSGAFSEYVHVEDAAYGYNLLKLSDETSFDAAVMTEPLSVATHGKNQAEVRPHEHVVIYGAGTIGLCALEACLSVGCKAPVVVDVNQDRLKVVKKLGGTPFDPTAGTPLTEFLFGHFGCVVSPFGDKTVDVDAYIDCAGAAGIIDDIVKMSKPQARVAVVAVYKKPVTFDMVRLGSSEITIRGSLGYRNSDVLEAYQNIDSHRNHVDTLVTHQFPHDKIVEAFETASNPKSGAIKVVINYEM